MGSNQSSGITLKEMYDVKDTKVEDINEVKEMNDVTDVNNKDNDYKQLMEEAIKDKRLEVLMKTCRDYMSDDKYVFKSALNVTGLSDEASEEVTDRDWLVVMMKIERTITNEERKNVVDNKYAKFRANALQVIAIINMNSCERRNSITNIFTSKHSGQIKLIYEVGKVVECNEFDKNLDDVCSGGVHYFKTILPAYYYDKSSYGYNGVLIRWYGNGRMKTYEQYKNGFNDGIRKEWYENGIKKTVCNYIDGVKYGKAIGWYENGKKSFEKTFVDGYLAGSGIWYHYDKNGKKSWCYDE